jgi:TolB-like protein
MSRAVGALWVAVLMAAGDRPASVRADQAAKAAASPKTHVVVFDFQCGDETYGKKLANAVRMRLRRHAGLVVVDRFTTADHSPPLPATADVKRLLRLMTDELAVRVALYGTVEKRAGRVRLDLRCLDLRAGTGPKQRRGWKKLLEDDTQRSEAVISKSAVEAFTGRPEWVPPQYGDEPEPKSFGKPLNRNGSFDAGHIGWQHPDNAATFIERGPAGRGKVLRVRTDLQRWPYIHYIRAIRMGRADPKRPPRIGKDTSYASLGGMEGVHFKSEWIKATAGQRYWLCADYLRPGGKVFVKGFRKTEHALDGMPESALAHLRLTPKQFAALPEARRRKLIADEARKHPKLFLRECYRWYLNCRGKAGTWNRLAAPFPPRGGLPKYVEWLQIQVYSYWPAATYHYDNVFLYKDPRQTAPLPEVKPRTPNFGKTSDVVERATAGGRQGSSPRPGGR